MAIPQNPRVVVTGGAGGLGRAFCLEFAKRGARVIVADIDERGTHETVELVERTGGSAIATRCDVARLADVEATAARIRRVFVELLARWPTLSALELARE